MKDEQRYLFMQPRKEIEPQFFRPVAAWPRPVGPLGAKQEISVLQGGEDVKPRHALSHPDRFAADLYRIRRGLDVLVLLIPESSGRQSALIVGLPLMRMVSITIPKQPTEILVSLVPARSSAASGP